MKHPLPSDMCLSPVFHKNAEAYLNGARLIINQGGTSSSKTFSIIQLLILLSIGMGKTCVTSILSESMPHLKLGAMRDFEKIMGTAYDDKRWNATEHLYDFGKASLEFFSADTPGKAHGPRRNNLFLNEVNNIPKSIVQAAMIRTEGTIWADYNPNTSFWLMDEIGKPGVVFIESTYLDAKVFLPATIVRAIESMRDKDPNWWRVYGEGKVGNIQGVVHPNFTLIDTMPEVGNGKEVFGLDFGYTNDPTALVRSVLIGDHLCSDELIYETGMLNSDIIKRLELLGVRKNYDEIVADCAEPKSIAEIADAGYNVIPCVKGADSVIHGVQTVNQFRQSWTKRSVHGIKEQRGYSYIQDREGNFTNKIMDCLNHLMDARRYSVVYKTTQMPLQLF